MWQKTTQTKNAMALWISRPPSCKDAEAGEKLLPEALRLLDEQDLKGPVNNIGCLPVQCGRYAEEVLKLCGIE